MIREECHRDPASAKPFAVGFHGDEFLLKLVDSIVPHCSTFIETGCNVGSTASYVAGAYPGLRIRTCEPDMKAYAISEQALEGLVSATVVNESSPEFLYALFDNAPELCRSCSICWLDAHGNGYRWPLADEIAYLTSQCQSGFLLIDDFQVPDQPQFSFDEYQGQVCGIELVMDSLAPSKDYQLVLPAYSEHTSSHHPLVGVALIVFGVGYTLPPNLVGAFTIEVIRT